MERVLFLFSAMTAKLAASKRQMSPVASQPRLSALLLQTPQLHTCAVQWICWTDPWLDPSCAYWWHQAGLPCSVSLITGSVPSSPLHLPGMRCVFCDVPAQPGASVARTLGPVLCPALAP